MLSIFRRAMKDEQGATAIEYTLIAALISVAAIVAMLSIFRRLIRNEKGATAIEYTLIASLIAVAAIAAMGSVGGKVNSVLTNVASSMK